MVRNTNSTVIGIPSRGRRIGSFMIDFWFSLLTLSGIGALAPLGLEATRTGHFVWHFQRVYTVGTDGVFELPSVLIFMTLMVLYFVFPLTRGKQTVGCFIMRLKTTPPFGDGGRFTFRAALSRTIYEFRGLTSVISRDWKRDSEGRTWYDIETNCTVVLIGDD
jgi:RDD family